MLSIMRVVIIIRGSCAVVLGRGQDLLCRIAQIAQSLIGALSAGIRPRLGGVYA